MSQEFHHIGKAVPTESGLEIVTGQEKFTDDLRMAGMLHAKMLRSPHQHARIKSIDTRKALALKGVAAVLSHENIYKYIPRVLVLDTFLMESETLYALDSEVFYVGDEVACVAAESEEIAEDALDLIDVEYEVLPAIFDAEEAVKEKAPPVHTRLDTNLVGKFELQDILWGDPEQGLREADLFVEGKYSCSLQTHATLETNCVICEWSNDELRVTATIQSPANLHLRLAKALGLPQSKIRVTAPRIGGGFGGKPGYAEGRLSIVLAALARMTGRPVKMRLTMAEKLACTHTRYPTVAYLKAGAKRDGNLTLLQGTLIANEGAHALIHGITEGVACSRFDTYRIPNYDFHAQAVYTNKVPSGPMRPLTGCECFWLSESFFDEVAEKLDEDPMEFRARNHVRTGDIVHLMFAFPYGKSIIPGADPPLLIRMAAEKFGWKAKWKGWRKTVEVRGTKVRSIGLAVGSNICGIHYSTVILKVNPDGSVNVGLPVAEMGQGLTTAVSQVTADVLGVSPESIFIHHDTPVAGFAYGSIAQCGLPLNAGAAKLAAEDARKQILELAVPRLEAKLEELDMENGDVLVRSDPERRASIPALLFHHGSFITIVGRGMAHPAYMEHDPKTALPLQERSYHVGLAEVEVDTETGEVQVLKAVTGVECGRVINPAIIEQQLQGALIMGLEYALYDGIVHDKRDGSVLNASLTDYRVPTILDLPAVSETVVSADPTHARTCVVYNAKSMSEAPETVVAPMLLNAVYNAIGVRIREGALTPSNVLNAMGKIKQAKDWRKVNGD
jgi:xanthine dehydrogenase molybdenum-binding subunit